MSRSTTTTSSQTDTPKTQRQWLSQFNHAYALASIIPILICVYLLTVRFFSFSALAGMGGVFLFVAVVLSLLGLMVGRQLLRSLLRQLLESNQRLKESQALQSEFVGHVAHELRSPLGLLRGSLDNLRDGLHGELTPDQLEPIGVGIREVDRLKRVVAELLDIGQIESGKVRLNRESLILQELLKDVVELCKHSAEKKALHLELQAPEASIILIADRDRLSQIILNLVMNAIKFTERGSVHVRLAYHGTTAQIEVVDSGPGIPTEHLGTIFQKFERLASRNIEGSGLGLPIAKALVELHQGKIWAESEPGKGSRFIVQLPMVKTQ